MIALGELSHGLASHSLICAVWGVGSRGLAVARSGSRDCAPSQRPARQFANTLMHVSDRWQAGTREYRAASGSNQVSMRSSDNIAGRRSEGHTTGSGSDLEGKTAADTEVSVLVSSVEARERAAM